MDSYIGFRSKQIW